jgi:hypothetical protein
VNANFELPRRPRIIISKETTYILEPLRPDGYVDCIAGINQWCSAGVTPENNAAVPLLRAVGPKSIAIATRKRFFQLLGIPDLPEEGPYLVAIEDIHLHDRGAYPATLCELRPAYLAEMPIDPFNDHEFHYRREDDGYLLYSVGPNGKDDGGRNFMQDDEHWYENESASEEEQARDDIAIRTTGKNSTNN